jgi:hypothetical protein
MKWKTCAYPYSREGAVDRRRLDIAEGEPLARQAIPLHGQRIVNALAEELQLQRQRANGG